MAKIAILTIGMSNYALSPKVDAAKLLAALTQAEMVDSEGYGPDEIFFPEKRPSYRDRLELRYINPRQLRATKPEPEKANRLEG